MKLWVGRFRKGENKLMEEFNKSFAFSLAYNLISKATWSFLLRAVCSFLPTSPILSIRFISTNLLDLTVFYIKKT